MLAVEVLLSQINVSPTFADCDAYVPSVITLYVSPTDAVPSTGSVVIVPPVPRLPLNIIGSGSVDKASATAWPLTGAVPVGEYVLVVSLAGRVVGYAGRLTTPLDGEYDVSPTLTDVTVPVFFVYPA